MNTTYIKKPDILKWYIYKILLIMRLTTVILMISMLQVSASTVAQEFNYVKKGVSLIQIFKEIKKQTGYNIIWNEKKVDVTATIDANFKKATIHDVLNKCLSNLPLSYSINDKMVMIKEKEPSFRKKLADFFKAIDVRGRVVGENNQPLAGATVKVKGTKISTSTNADGEFVLNNVNELAILVISHLGYETQEVKAAKNVAPIKLVLSADRLKEVEINAGYYMVTNRERTGSISKITSSMIRNQPINNPLMALQGRVAGLEITQQTGTPGGGFTVRIRGRNSLNSGNEPLYVVDGVVYPSQNISSVGGATTYGKSGANSPSTLAFINPNDIASIEILKDADATAIYGSRGANGVVLVTTKRGRIGKTNIDAAISQGISEVGHSVDLLNTSGYLMLRNEAFKNDGLAFGTTDYDVNGIYDRNKYTDWQKLLIGGTANITNSSLEVSGGTEKSNYLIGGSYYSEGTVTPGNFGIRRAGFRTSINLGSISDRFFVNFTGNYSSTVSKLSISDLTPYILLAPNAPDPYDENGKINWNNDTFRNNPMALLLRKNDSNTQNLIGSILLNFRIVKDLHLKTLISYSSIIRNEFSNRPLESLAPATNPTALNRTSNFSNNFNNNLMIEPQLSYSYRLGMGKIDALIGMTLQNARYQLNSIEGSGYSNDQLMESLGAASSIIFDAGSSYQYRYAAFFGRLNYNVKDKYFINLTARRDGSSRFGPDKQLANFGAIGAAWIFSDEDFFKPISFLSFGKLRASIGVTGNDQIGNYGYLPLWSSGVAYQGTTTLLPGALANADFAWESNKKLEAAIQLGFLKGKLNLEVSWYRNRSSNQLIYKDLPISTGPAIVYINLPAKVENRGFELDLNTKILTTRSFSWSSFMNLTIPRNELLSYPDLEISYDKNNYTIGQPLSIKKLYNATINTQTGLYQAEDINGNGSRDVADNYLDQFFGQRFYGGLQNSVTYKQFNLDFLFSFTKQDGKSYMNTSVSPGYYRSGASQNQVVQVLDRWRQPGDVTSVQRSSTLASNYTNYLAVAQGGNLSVVDASFIRLKNVSLSYTLSKSLVERMKISNARISLQAQNIFTLTNYIGLDPETQALDVLPPLRTLTVGLNVTF